MNDTSIKLTDRLLLALVSKEMKHLVDIWWPSCKDVIFVKYDNRVRAQLRHQAGLGPYGLGLTRVSGQSLLLAKNRLPHRGFASLRSTMFERSMLKRRWGTLLCQSHRLRTGHKRQSRTGII